MTCFTRWFPRSPVHSFIKILAAGKIGQIFTDRAEKDKDNKFEIMDFQVFFRPF